jgi:adenosylmethionine-8-amino-7-oxononanoate aminotransferase
MSNVFGRRSDIQPPVAVGGEGPFLIDSTGKRYLDACGGAAVSCLGHSANSVTQAVSQQLEQLAWAHSGFFTSEPAEQLAQWLAAHSPGDLNQVYFVSGGSEAIESSLKLARQYWVESDQPQRSHIISRRQSYHGNTLGALGAGGNVARRHTFEPLLNSQVHLIDPCHYWRWGEPGESTTDYALRMANQLEEKILSLPPDSVAAFVAEPVVGATMGAVAAESGYFTRIRQICDQYGVLLILDEVMCGMGRTGTLFACEQDDISPDIVCIAKALGAGIQPIGAMICSQRIFDRIADGSGAFMHGHTYMAHPAACAAGLAVMQEIESGNLLANVDAQGQLLRRTLHEQLDDHPNVGDIRGRGLFVGIEFVENRETKAPLNPELKAHAKLKAAAFERGLMVYPMGGTIDGRRGDHVLLAPPYTIDASHVQLIADTLCETIQSVMPAMEFT